jgi:hypothetical protein
MLFIIWMFVVHFVLLMDTVLIYIIVKSLQEEWGLEDDIH